MIHQTFIADSTDGSGRSARAEVALICEVRQALTRPWVMVRLEDISEQGFRIALLPNGSPDKPMWIKIPGLQVLKANICWQEGRAVGCKFEASLHIAVFENIVRLAASASLSSS